MQENDKKKFSSSRLLLLQFREAHQKLPLCFYLMMDTKNVKFEFTSCYVTTSHVLKGKQRNRKEVGKLTERIKRKRERLPRESKEKDRR